MRSLENEGERTTLTPEEERQWLDKADEAISNARKLLKLPGKDYRSPTEEELTQK